MGYVDVIYEVEEGVAMLTLNRPDKLNALNGSLLQEAAEAVEEAGRDDAVKALILTGAGRGFCSGADLAARSGQGYPGAGRRDLLTPFGGYGHLVLSLRNLPKPTIAAVNGAAAGGGFSVALCCDIVYASDRATFSAIFVRRGLVPDMGLTYFLPRLIGAPKALELMFTGRVIDAAEAERLGIVNRIVPHEELLDAARELASSLASGPTLSIELTKQAVYKGLASDLTAQLGFEAYAQGIARNSEDVREAITAFLEKRQPKFVGR